MGHSEETKRKISQKLKENEYLGSTQWRNNIAEANRDPERIARKKATWKAKRNWETATPAVKKKWVKEDVGHCEQCGISEWQSRSLPLEVHHIDGDRHNNVRENLQVLCPNCHAQTDTWRRKKST